MTVRWLIQAAVALREAAHFEYHSSMEYEVVRELLEGYSGHVVSNAYGACDHLGGRHG